MTPTTSFVVIPGLSTTINVPVNSVVVLSTDGGVQTTSTSTTGVSRVDIAFAIDGSIVPAGGYRRVIAQNTGGSTTTIENYSMTTSVTLAAGNHTFAVQTALNNGATATVSGNATSVLQGTLTIRVVKL